MSVYFRLPSATDAQKNFPAIEKALNVLHNLIQPTMPTTSRRFSLLSAKDLPQDEPTKVITVRLPTSFHQALISQAYAHQTSLNTLCLSKLALGLVIMGKSRSDKGPKEDETG